MVSLVLLGAGASYGSQDVIPRPPPLGNGENGLFKKLVEQKNNGIAANISIELQEIFINNFEDGMKAYIESKECSFVHFQKEMAGYFSQFLPGNSNTYIKLINEIGINRAIYSSLNYDLLFEEASNMVGYNCRYDTTLTKGNIRLLKIHGSCNFWADTPKNFTSKIDGAAKITDSKGGGSMRSRINRIISRQEVLDRCKDDSLTNSWGPIMALYAEGKPVKVNPKFIEEQYDMWKSIVNKANKIFIIGVRVNEADQHIWKVFGETPAWLGYCGLKQDKQDFNAWKNKSNKKKAYFFEGNFENSVRWIKNNLKIK